ncbi:MAG: hypothetical protein HKM24_05450 [Gammaproteobacteria bacterium]|nr:hypothetical protein [Gammaproteobacteria bacterium]
MVHTISDRVRKELELRGFNVHANELTEFMKAGGAAKCLTLRLLDSKV